MSGGVVQYRFAEKTAKQAMILRLARIVSGLRAANTLLELGYLQEQAAICRMVDEFQDDVVFLTLATLEHPTPALLQKYLNSVFEDERSIDDFRAGSRVKGRALVGRKDITNYISRHESAEVDHFQTSNAALAVSYTLSGFIHGASTHIMEMYDPVSNKFVTEPSPAHPLYADHAYGIWDHYYRGLLAFGYAARAFDDNLAMRSFQAFREIFETESGDRKDF